MSQLQAIESKLPKICFVSLTSYPLLTNRNMGTAGGAEVQQVLIGKELANCGVDVCFISHADTSSEDNFILDRMHIISAYQRDKNLNLISKMLHLWKAMSRANADIYYHYGGCPGIVGLFSRINNRKFIYHVASDGEFLEKGGINNTFFLKIAHRFDIELSDLIIAQNNFQKRVIAEKFKKKSLIMKNAFAVPDESFPEKEKPPIVLWVGSISSVKQPEIFLKLAEHIPKARFQMIGGVSEDKALFGKIKEMSEKIDNLEFLGFIPFHCIDKYFKNASLFVSTSKFEGFPNTFIQAWMHYVPVISLNVDPNESICNLKLGMHSSSFSKLVEDTKLLLQDENLRRALGENSRKYVEKEHDIKKIIVQYIQLFKDI